MTTATQPTSVRERLAELDAAIAEADRELATVERGHGATSRELTAAEAALRDYHAGVGRGAKPNPGHEARLLAAADRIRGRTKVDRDGRPVDVQVEAAAGRLRVRLRQLANERAATVRAERDALTAELLAAGDAAVELQTAAYRHLVEANRAWGRVAGEVLAMARDLEVDPRDVPPSPLQSAVEQVRARLQRLEGSPALATPLPWSLLPPERLGTSKSIETPTGLRPNPALRGR